MSNYVFEADWMFQVDSKNLVVKQNPVALFGDKSPGWPVVADRMRAQGIERRADPSRTEGAGVAGRLGVLALHVFIHCTLVSTCVTAHWASKDALRQTRDQTPNSIIWIWEKKRIGFKENLFSIKHLLQYCPRMFVFEVLLQITWCWESKGTQVTWYTDDKVFNFNVVANVCGFLVRKVAFSARPDSFSIGVHQKDHPRLYPFLSFSNWF